MGSTGALHKCPSRRTRSSTFLVRILYTQNASTQGILQWVDQEKALPFRSFLELIHLLEEALQTREDMDQFRDWREADQIQTEWR